MGNAKTKNNNSIRSKEMSAGIKIVTDVEVLEAVFQMQPDPSRAGWLKGFKNGAEVMRKLEPAMYSRGFGEPIQINKNTIGDIIQWALDKAKLRLSSEHEYSFTTVSAPVTRLKKRRGLVDLHVLTEEESAYGDFNVVNRAAKVFADMVKAYENPLVSIGGGQTMRRMIPALETNASNMIRVVAANLVVRMPKMDDEEDRRSRQTCDSSNLADRVSYIYNQSDPAVFGLPPLPVEEVMEDGFTKVVGDPVKVARYHSERFEENPQIKRVFQYSLNPDITFLGAGNFYPESPTIERLYRLVGIDGEMLARMRPAPIGDINFCFFDAEGNDMTSQILMDRMRKVGVRDNDLYKTGSFFKGQPLCHPFLVGVNMRGLRELVKNKKRVVVVAGGNGIKAEAVFALLKTRTINGLVTDKATLDRLLELDELAARDDT